jgi:plasmid stabilization system protein ParE
MPYHVIFTDEADDTFDSIGNQIENRWGERERNTFRKRVYEVVDIIADFPFISKRFVAT